MRIQDNDDTNIAGFLDKLLLQSSELLSNAVMGWWKTKKPIKSNRHIKSDLMLYRYRSVNFVSLLEVIEANDGGLVVFDRDREGFVEGIENIRPLYFSLFDHVFNPVNDKEYKKKKKNGDDDGNCFFGLREFKAGQSQKETIVTDIPFLISVLSVLLELGVVSIHESSQRKHTKWNAHGTIPAHTTESWYELLNLKFCVPGEKKEEDFLSDSSTSSNDDVRDGSSKLAGKSKKRRRRERGHDGNNKPQKRLKGAKGGRLKKRRKGEGAKPRKRKRKTPDDNEGDESNEEHEWEDQKKSDEEQDSDDEEQDSDEEEEEEFSVWQMMQILCGIQLDGMKLKIEEFIKKVEDALIRGKYLLHGEGDRICQPFYHILYTTKVSADPKKDDKYSYYRNSDVGKAARGSGYAARKKPPKSKGTAAKENRVTTVTPSKGGEDHLPPDSEVSTTFNSDDDSSLRPKRLNPRNTKGVVDVQGNSPASKKVDKVEKKRRIAVLAAKRRTKRKITDRKHAGVKLVDTEAVVEGGNQSTDEDELTHIDDMSDGDREFIHDSDEEESFRDKLEVMVPEELLDVYAKETLKIWDARAVLEGFEEDDDDEMKKNVFGCVPTSELNELKSAEDAEVFVNMLMTLTFKKLFQAANLLSTFWGLGLQQGRTASKFTDWGTSGYNRDKEIERLEKESLPVEHILRHYNSPFSSFPKKVLKGLMVQKSPGNEFFRDVNLRQKCLEVVGLAENRNGAGDGGGNGNPEEDKNEEANKKGGDGSGGLEGEGGSKPGGSEGGGNEKSQPERKAPEGNANNNANEEKNASVKKRNDSVNVNESGNATGTGDGGGNGIAEENENEETKKEGSGGGGSEGEGGSKLGESDGGEKEETLSQAPVIVTQDDFGDVSDKRMTRSQANKLKEKRAGKSSVNPGTRKIRGTSRK